MTTPFDKPQLSTSEDYLIASLYIHARLIVRTDIGDLLYWVPEGFNLLASRLCASDHIPFYRHKDLRWYFVPHVHFIKSIKDLRSLSESDVARCRRCAPLLRDLIWRINFAATTKLQKSLFKDEFVWLQDVIGVGNWCAGVRVEGSLVDRASGRGGEGIRSYDVTN